MPLRLPKSSTLSSAAAALTKNTASSASGITETGTACRAASQNLSPRTSLPLYWPLSAPIRLFCAVNKIPTANPVALQMIDYAIGLARSQKSDESYAQGLLVLEQCLSSQSREVGDVGIEDSKGMVWLAVSTLLYESGHTNEAIETLLRIQGLTSSCLGIRVAAAEALVGLNLELGLDDTSSVLSDNCLKILEKEGHLIGDDQAYKVLDTRAKSIKGLVELVRSDMESAKALFQVGEDESRIGNAALSFGEFLHIKREFASAKEVYNRVIEGSSEKKDFSDPYALSSGNMTLLEVILGATCALGQLESHLGNFQESEQILTKALKIAEEHFVSNSFWFRLTSSEGWSCPNMHSPHVST
ncbi:hypothetical protein Droror1_Dr00014409 [Drosera rotundifolia]